MVALSIITICLLFVDISIVHSAPEVIPCPLIWQDVISGESYPEFFIPAAKYGTEYVITKAKEVVGYAAKGECLNFDGTNVTTHETYQVLTNPFGCDVEWIPYDNGVEGLQRIKLNSNLMGNVGRVMSPAETRLLGGHIREGPSLEILVAVSDSDGVIISDEFEMLQSTQKGLNLVVTDIIFEEGTTLPEYIPKVLGIDQIINRSPGTISQTVRHTSKYESVVKFAKGLWGPVQGIKFEFQFASTDGIESKSPVEGIEFPKFDEIFFDNPYVYSEESESYEEAELKEYIEQEIQANVTFTVNANTAVQICSTSNVIEGFEANFRGKGHYTATGLTGLEIESILSKFGITGDIRDDEVIVDIDNNIRTSYFSSSMFLTAPLELVGEGSCYQMAEVVDEIEKDKGKLSFFEIQGKLRALKKSMNLMTKL